MSANGSQRVVIDGTTIHYTDMGEGTPVLCLHGNPGCAADFATSPIEGYRVIAMDRPGHGESQRYTDRDNHLDTQVEFIHKFADALELGPFLLTAHSWGCFLALSYALAHGETLRAMLLFAPIAYPRQVVETPSSGLVRLMRFPLFGKAACAFLAATAGKSAVTTAMAEGFEPQGMPEKYRMTVLPDFVHPARFQAMCEDKADFEYQIMARSQEYGVIDTQTLLVCGEKDRVAETATQAEPLKCALQNASLRVIPGTGHQIPQLCTGILKESLQAMQ